MEKFSLSQPPPLFPALDEMSFRLFLISKSNGKSSRVHDTEWSSLVARRVHNPKVGGSNPSSVSISDLPWIYDDVSNLVTGARIVPERMIWQLLAPANGTPGITIKANGVNYTYNYDPDGTWKKSNYKALTTSAKWDTPASATPIADLIAAAEAVNDATGEEVTRVFMNKATLAKMIAADEVKNRFLTINNRTTSVLTMNEAKEVVRQATGLEIFTYNKKYRPEGGGDTAKYLPDGYVVLAPDGNLGTTWYGTTPEEADLLSGQSGASVSIVNTGVAITTELTVHPVNANVYASEIVLPSFERMDAVYCIKAY